MALKIATDANGYFYWGGAPLPAGSEMLGVVTRGEFDHGALIKLTSGIYVQGNASVTRSLSQDEVATALSRRAGRPATGTQRRKINMTLPESEIEQLREIGNGNASAGVSRLLADKQ
ncbi:MAG: hypothetical protein ACOYD4_06800 [Solirubrobacterales bacterium]